MLGSGLLVRRKEIELSTKVITYLVTSIANDSDTAPHLLDRAPETATDTPRDIASIDCLYQFSVLVLAVADLRAFLAGFVCHENGPVFHF